MYKSKKYHKKNKKTRKNSKKTCKHYLGKKCKTCFKKNMKGGYCGSCSNHLQVGGNFYKPPLPIPGPFVGQSWNYPVNSWPGVNGVGGDRNYLPYNKYLTDPQTAMKLNGGKKNRNKTKTKQRTKKGGLLPQDLVNLGRDIGYNMGSAYNALNGYPAPVNPLPYKDQLTNPIRSLT